MRLARPVKAAPRGFANDSRPVTLSSPLLLPKKHDTTRGRAWKILTLVGIALLPLSAAVWSLELLPSFDAVRSLFADARAAHFVDRAGRANAGADPALQGRSREEGSPVSTARSRIDELRVDLVAARQEAERLGALLSEERTQNRLRSQQAAALAVERKRVEQLTMELISARQEAAELAVSLTEVRSQREPVPAADPQTDQKPGTRVDERGRPDAARDGDIDAPASQRPATITSGVSPSAQDTMPTRQASPDSPPRVPARSEPKPAAASAAALDEPRALSLASALLRQGDIAGARSMLEFALTEMNSARAAFMLAETYDWRMLRSWRARGVKGDVSTALQLYRRAANGGVEPAKERMVELDAEARRKPAGN